MSTATAECCCAYNMMKLTRHLYGWTADPRYFDYYEKLMLNHRLGTILPDKGYTQYYLSLTPGTWKTFNTEGHSFWCCTGSGVEEYSKLADSIYWHDGEGLYVNQFIPSELNWSEKGLQRQAGNEVPRTAGHQPHADCRKAGADVHPAAHSRVAGDGSYGKDQRPRAGSLGRSRQLSDD